MPTKLTQTGAEVQQDLYTIEDIDLATPEKAGLMSPEDKSKLDVIEDEIPTKLSDLEADSTHQTVTATEKQTWNNKSNFSGRYPDLTDKPYIPQWLADLSSDISHRTVSDTEKAFWNDKVNQAQIADFITRAVNDLVNYYTKSQVDDLVAAVQGVSFVIAEELPTASADTMGKIYLVPSADPQTANIKDEYITIDNGESAETRYTWEQIGSTAISFDLISNTDINALFS